jgi:hypothetical protein
MHESDFGRKGVDGKCFLAVMRFFCFKEVGSLRSLSWWSGVCNLKNGRLLWAV